MNEDIFPIENGDFPASHLSFSGGVIPQRGSKLLDDLGCRESSNHSQLRHDMNPETKDDQQMAV